jgi:hypothetical protein
LIKNGIIFINDILDEYDHISEYKIIAKLRNKQKWISELNILKKAIPKQWKDILTTKKLLHQHRKLIEQHTKR